MLWSKGGGVGGNIDDDDDDDEGVMEDVKNDSNRIAACTASSIFSSANG